MKKIYTIALKELQSYFFSPIAYIVFSSFLVIVGYLFWVILVGIRMATLEPLLDNAAFILLLVTPVLTMKLMSEERKTKTIELLLTSPISPSEIILGKFFACFFLYFVLIILTLQYPYIISIYSVDFDLGPVYTGYIGLLFLSSALISVGLFTSTLTENQIVSAMLSLGILVVFWLLGWAKHTLNNQLGDFLGNFSIFDKYSEFLKGMLDSSNIVFFVVFTVIWLFMATRVLESERWR